MLKISTAKTLSYYLLVIRDATTSIVDLKIDNSTLALEKVVIFLGGLFDKQLTWTPHINYVVDKCKTHLNLMRCVSGPTYGASKQTLLIMYKALIRSILNYGAIAYDSASTSTKEKLDVIQGNALRICCCAMTDAQDRAFRWSAARRCYH